MAETVRAVGSAMWGGRDVKGEVVETDPGTVATPPRISMSIRDLVSILLVVTGAMCGITGAAILWGTGGLLLAVAVVAAPIGLLIGLSGDR